VGKWAFSFFFKINLRKSAFFHKKDPQNPRFQKMGPNFQAHFHLSKMGKNPYKVGKNEK